LLIAAIILVIPAAYVWWKMHLHSLDNPPNNDDTSLSCCSEAHHLYDLQLHPGVRVEAAGIEIHVTALSGVQEAYVEKVQQGDGHWLVAFVTCDGDIKVSEHQEDWQASLQEKLPSAAIPTLWIELDSIPTSPDGSVDRQALRRRGDATCRLQGSRYEWHPTSSLHGLLESATQRWPDAEAIRGPNGRETKTFRQLQAEANTRPPCYLRTQT